MSEGYLRLPKEARGIFSAIGLCEFRKIEFSRESTSLLDPTFKSITCSMLEMKGVEHKRWSILIWEFLHL